MARKSTDFIVVHCAATPPDMDIGVKEIDRWHRARGWLKCGYHYVITRDGTLQHGRKADEPGAHVRGYNDRSVGICLVGGTTSTGQPRFNFTPEQMQALTNLIESLRGVYPEAKIVGHHDLDSGKECPCFNVQEWFHDTFH